MPAITLQEAFGLALASHENGRLAEAEALYVQILAAHPDHVPTLANMGMLFSVSDRNAEAISTFQRVLRLAPGHAETHSNLGLALMETGEIEAALEALQRAVALKPDLPQAHNNLGNALLARDRRPEAIGAFEQARRLAPQYAEAHYNLGITLHAMGRLDEAAATLEGALKIRPDYVEARNNLANVLHEQGRVGEAIAQFREALRSRPGQAMIHSNLAYLLHFDPDEDDQSIAAELRCWNRAFVRPLRGLIAPPTNDRNPDRRLRIGYVSPDFYMQAESFFLVPLLEAHDQEQFEIHAYASVARPDEITGRIRQSCDVWHDVGELSADALAQRIRADGIDILVDLTMHMAANRLPVFARRPAPVQVAWLAYPGATGLETMDYRMTDAIIDPPENGPSVYPEELIRLPDCWCCYAALAAEEAVTPLPAERAGGITFGCLNNPAKINALTLGHFAAVLRTVEGSRLMILAPEGTARQRMADQLGRHGVTRERLEFVSRTTRSEYLKLHHRIDIALDTLPYNGITTTCDSLWMGVPVLSVEGKTGCGRVGRSLLTAVGLSEFAVRSPEALVSTAKDLAGNLPKLARLRETMRERMVSSALMDAGRFAGNLEGAFRSVWGKWCAAGGE
jgi:predicted O-linked N-acetylglucosamine transferase (SPINDLY family)